MLDIRVAQRILTSRKIAYLLVDEQFTVIDGGGDLSLCRQQMAPVGASLLTVSPEFVGMEAVLAALLQGELPEFHLEFVNRESTEGEVHYLTLTLYPHHAADGTQRQLLHLIEDLTPIGRANQQLTQQHNELYLLHQQLAAANLHLAAANAELEALDALKSRFVSIAAHELRTPISTMMGYVDFLLQDDQDPLTAQQQNHLTVVKRSAQRLLATTSDLLDMARLEAGRMELLLERTNLLQLVNTVHREFRHEIAAKALAVTVSAAEPLPAVLCDEKRSMQILHNLVGNAIKYTPQGGRVTIALRAICSPHQPAGGGEDAIEVAVIDSGIGIPATDLTNLGKAFFRASNVHKARAAGTGLGLHITRLLCELQGGALTLESTEGIGTTARATFPIDN
jgi:signal transduction histidine kinase